MANLLSQSAKTRGKAYSAGENAEWEAIVSTLWTLLTSQRGTVHEASSVARQLKQALENHLQGEGHAVEASAFFNRMPGAAVDRVEGVGLLNSRAADLNTLVDYIVHAACALFAEREAAKRVVPAERLRLREAVEPERRRVRTLLMWCPEVIANARIAADQV